MRVRSGYIPNVLTLGFRKQLGADTKLSAQISIWGQIETGPPSDQLKGGGRFPRPATAATEFGPTSRRVHEGRGAVGRRPGRPISVLYSRGMTETEFLYGHRYGVGFPGVDVSDYIAGSVSQAGPITGMAGFGILASTYSAGLVYTTPDVSGVKLAAGLFEPVLLQARAGARRASRDRR